MDCLRPGYSRSRIVIRCVERMRRTVQNMAGSCGGGRPLRRSWIDFRGKCLCLLRFGVISQKVLMKSFRRSQFLHKSVNSSFIIANLKNKVTIPWRS